MKTLDLGKIWIIGSEWDCIEPINRIYVVAKQEDPEQEYDDPMTCVVEFEQNWAFTAQKFHQFMKFNCPVPLDVSEERRTALMNQLLLLPIREQRKLIWLYDPKTIENPEEIVLSEMCDYVNLNLLEQVRKEELEMIRTGFMLHYNYSRKHEISIFVKEVRLYLSSMDIFLDENKVEKVVRLIVEYLTGIGRWHQDYPF